MTTAVVVIATTIVAVSRVSAGHQDAIYALLKCP
jgi:hypothetical protein